MPVPPTVGTEAQLLEIFSSVQGEGTWIGRRQIFIRFARCNRACAYCDTAVEPVPCCRVENRPGAGLFHKIPNPVSGAQLLEIVNAWLALSPNAHHSLSITGGEPLLQEGVLAEWLPVLRKLLPIHLETNGTLPGSLRRLLPHIDYIAMDIKLASVTGEKTPWEEHREFLRLSAEKEGCVKIVIAPRCLEEEVKRGVRLAADQAPALPLILQPRTGGESFSPGALLHLQEALAQVHPDVRVIPQVHTFLKLL